MKILGHRKMVVKSLGLLIGKKTLKKKILLVSQGSSCMSKEMKFGYLKFLNSGMTLTKMVFSTI